MLTPADGLLVSPIPKEHWHLFLPEQVQAAFQAQPALLDRLDLREQPALLEQQDLREQRVFEAAPVLLGH